MNDPTQQELLEVFNYDPIEGSFYWTHHKNVYINVRGKRTATALCNGHCHIRFKGRTYKAHHIAWCIVTGSWPINQIDHKDNNRSNNIFTNLREATHHQNMMNRYTAKNNTSGYKGVIKRRYGGYEAVIQWKGKKVYLGKFLDPVEAAIAYDVASLHHFGEFAKTNKQLGLI